MHRIRGKLTYSNVMVTVLALVVLGGGTAYAASHLGKGSVGTRQLRKEAVTPAKLSKMAKATLTGPAGPRGATGATGAAGPRGLEGPRGLQGEKGTSGSSALLSTELKRDLTLRGRFNVDEQATKAEQISGAAISFGLSLAQAPTVEKIGDTPTANCPGTAEDPRAAPGFLCLYRVTESNTDFVGAIAYPFGANISVRSEKVGRFFYEGAWAVTGN